MGSTEPKPRKIRVLNEGKKASKDTKAKNAVDGKANAHKKHEEEVKRAAGLAEKIAKLEELGDEKKTQEVKNQIQGFQEENVEANANITAAMAEETRFEEEYNRVLEMDEYEETDNPDFLEPTTENLGGSSGGREEGELTEDDEDDDREDEDEEEDAYPDLISRDEMKKGFGMTSGVCMGWTKVGTHGKRPVIKLGPNSSPCFRTKKSSKFDGFVDPDKKYNLVKQRRMDVRNEDDTRKFTLADLDGCQGVSFAHEDDEDDDNTENPAEKLKPLPPKLTKKQKDAITASGGKIPGTERPEPVQVFLKWKQLYDKKWRSWETRSGIRALFGDDVKGDKFIYKAALEQEKKYQEYLDGQRPAGSRSATPFAAGKENTPLPKGKIGKTPTGLMTPLGGTPPPEVKIVPPGGQTNPSKAAKKAAMEEFKEIYLLAANIDEWEDLSIQQKADGIKAFTAFWTEKQVAG